MRISYFLRDSGACAWYRVELPMLTMQKHKEAELMRIEKGDGVDKIEAALNADLIVIPRVSEQPINGLIKKLREAGKKTVVDYDDDMFNICPFSSHYDEFGTEEVTINFKGKPLPLWQDGVNGFHLAQNRYRMDGIKRACESADMITVTTEKLAETYRQYNDNVAVLPNCLRFDMWKKLPFRSHEPDVRILWTGGSSHYRDWCILSDVMPEIMKKYRNVKLVLGGAKFDGTLKDCPKDRIEFKPWTAIQAHHLQCAIFDADIGVIPLEDNEFNSRKSCIKWLEMAALEVPCVVSYVSPYKEIYDGKNAVMIENNTRQGWIDGLSTLIEDKFLRIRIAAEAYKYALGHFDIDTQYSGWVKAYKGLLNGN